MHLSASLMRLHVHGSARREFYSESVSESLVVAAASSPAHSSLPPPLPPPQPVPSTAHAYLHQVAGHGPSEDGACFRAHRRRLSVPRGIDGLSAGSASDAAESVLTHAHTLLKPVRKEKGRREQRFYEELESLHAQLRTTSAACVAPASDAELQPAPLPTRDWLSFFARYYGTLHHPRADVRSVPVRHLASECAPSAPAYLHLEDLIASYTHPSLIDVKIGIHSHDPFECAAAGDAGREKIERERLKCASQSETGFRVCGARVWHGDRGEYDVFGKHWNRQLPATEAEQSFWTFLGHRPSPRMKGPLALRPTDATLRTATLILPIFLARLRLLRHLFQTAPRWRFYASSVLFCYELQPTPRAQLHLIDFGHTYAISSVPPDDPRGPSSSHIDHNFLVGVESLIGIFDRMLQRATDAVGVPSVVQRPFLASPPRVRVIPAISPSRRRLAAALHDGVMHPKSLSALLLYLIARRSVINGRANSLLFKLAADLRRAWPEVRRHQLHRAASTCAMQAALTRTVLGVLLQSQQLADEDDTRNTSFVRPAHTTNSVSSCGHPRTRRWRAQLQQHLQEEEARSKRGLSLASFARPTQT